MNEQGPLMRGGRRSGSGGLNRRDALLLGGATVVTGLSGLFALAWRRATGTATTLAAATGVPATHPAPSVTVPTAVPAGAETPDAAPASPEAVQSSAAVTAVPLEVLCRESWGAAPAGTATPHEIRRITVHHSASVLTDNRQAPQRIRGFQRFHQESRGWPDIAYHYVIDARGNVYEARSPDTVGDTSTDYDPTGHFLALCDGNFEEQEVPEAQFAALARLLAWAVREHGLSVEDISAHRDHAATACPGKRLYERVQSGELRRRVAEHLAAAPLTLSLLCGPVAEIRIRAIENGR